jgi:hypothetical protein
MKYIKLFEDKNQELISLTQRGSTVVPKESIKKELYDSCDAKISKLQEQLKKVNSIKSDLDSDFSDLDFFVRANFSELPGFSHYFYGKPYYPDTNVSYNLVVAFDGDEYKEIKPDNDGYIFRHPLEDFLKSDESKEIRSSIEDFLIDCQNLKSITLEKCFGSDSKFDIFEISDYSDRTYPKTVGFKYSIKIVTSIKRIPTMKKRIKS